MTFQHVHNAIFHPRPLNNFLVIRLVLFDFDEVNITENG